MAMGGPRDLYTLENYRYFLYGSTTSTSSWNTLHLTAVFTTIFVSILVTAFNFAFSDPLAFDMAQVATAARVRLLLLLLIAPYWINEVLRAFAFRVMFAGSGVINRLLQAIDELRLPSDKVEERLQLCVHINHIHAVCQHPTA